MKIPVNFNKLYHGSRGGLSGKIKPCSRERCDFGQGFYMGTNPNQVKGLVIEDSDPIFYELKLDSSKIENLEVLQLSGREWLYVVLANRNKLPEFTNSELGQKYLHLLDNYDIVYGCIAGDRMAEAIKTFEKNYITDTALMACLDSVNYGYQIVAKTQKACDAIEILKEKEIHGKEASQIRDYTIQKRRESKNIVEQMRTKYLRDGYYFSEILEKNKLLESEDLSQTK